MRHVASPTLIAEIHGHGRAQSHQLTLTAGLHVDKDVAGTPQSLVDVAGGGFLLARRIVEDELHVGPSLRHSAQHRRHAVLIPGLTEQFGGDAGQQNGALQVDSFGPEIGAIAGMFLVGDMERERGIIPDGGHFLKRPQEGQVVVDDVLVGATGHDGVVV